MEWNTIQADRFTIRRFAASDEPDLHAYLSAPTSFAFEPGDPIDKPAAVRGCCAP